MKNMMYASSSYNGATLGRGGGIEESVVGEIVKVDIKHELYPDKCWLEIRLDKNQPIEYIKNKLYTHCGTSPKNMKLYMYDPYDKNNQIYLENDQFTLNMYGCMDGYILYVKDITNKTVIGNAWGRNEEDLLKDKSTKYVISDEEYNKRSNTMRNFIKNIKENKKQENEKSEKTT